MTETRIVGAQPWRESLCGCCSDLSTCCLGFWCPCCLFGENMKKTSKEVGGCSGCCGYCMTYLGCCCAVHRPGRLAIREAYGLEEGTGCANDFCASWCCSCCGLCQEAREINARGPPPMVTVVTHAGAVPTGGVATVTGALTQQAKY